MKRHKQTLFTSETVCVASEGGLIRRLYKLAAKVWLVFVHVIDVLDICRKSKQYWSTWWEEPFREHTAHIQWGQISLNPPLSLAWLSWPFSRGFLFLWASQNHTLRGLPAWEKRERERERWSERGSLWHKLHLNVTHPKVSASFLDLSRSSVPAREHISLLPWKKAVVGQAPGHINPDKPSWSVFGWTFRSVAHLGPHKCWNSLNMWELWVFWLWLSRGLSPWNKNKHYGDSYSNHLNWIIFWNTWYGCQVLNL